MDHKIVLKILMIVMVSLIPADHSWSQQKINVTHALAMTGTPRYAEDFKHFAYANPGAPKGGDLKMGAIGTFDTFNRFIIRGVPAAGIS